MTCFTTMHCRARKVNNLLECLPWHRFHLESTEGRGGGGEMLWHEETALLNQTHGFTSHLLPAQTIQWDPWNSLTSSRKATERRRRNCSPPLFEDMSTEQRLLSHPMLVQRPLERCPLLQGEQWDIVSPSLEKQHRGKQPGDRSCRLNKGIFQMTLSPGLPLPSQVAGPKIPTFAGPH